MNVLRSALSYLASKLPAPRIIFDRAGVSPYLSRWYLLGRPTMPDGSHPFTEDGSPKDGILDPDRVFALFLHRFHRGDDDEELHNHPWKWALSLVLTGGYREERRRGAPERGGAVSFRTVRPFTLNLIHHDTFHRVDLLGEDAWSLFLAGPREKGWGFWNRTTGRYLPWKAFITWRRDPTAFLQDRARRSGPTSDFYANSAVAVDRPARVIASDGAHSIGSENLVEVDVYASERCGNEDCRACDDSIKRAEGGHEITHRVLTGVASRS